MWTRIKGPPLTPYFSDHFDTFVKKSRDETLLKIEGLQVSFDVPTQVLISPAPTP